MRKTFGKYAANLAYWPSYGFNWWMIRGLRRWNWYDQVDPLVYVGAVPSARLAHHLAEIGIKAVVNTCQEYAGPVQVYAEHSIEQLYLPTVDFVPPSLAFVEQGVDFIQRNVQAGKPVYVHCKAGRARSVTIVLCWLIEAKGMTPEEAQQFLQLQRRQSMPTIYQRQVVQDFVKKRIAVSPEKP